MNQHVDMNVLETLRDVMEGEYPMLLDVFLDDSVTRIEAMNDVLKAPGFGADSAADLQLLGPMAHSFKGSSSNMGATRLTELCRQLEELSRDAVAVDADTLRALVQQIAGEFSAVRDIFQQQLNVCQLPH